MPSRRLCVMRSTHGKAVAGARGGLWVVAAAARLGLQLHQRGTGCRASRMVGCLGVLVVFEASRCRCQVSRRRAT